VSPKRNTRLIENIGTLVTGDLDNGVSRSGASQVAGAAIVKHLRPDIVGHISGGPIPMPEGDIAAIVTETEFFLEVCSSGNPRMALRLMDLVKARVAFHRVVIGTDTPGGTGVIPCRDPSGVQLLPAYGTAGQSGAGNSGLAGGSLRHRRHAGRVPGPGGGLTGERYRADRHHPVWRGGWRPGSDPAGFCLGGEGFDALRDSRHRPPRCTAPTSGQKSRSRCALRSRRIDCSIGSSPASFRLRPGFSWMSFCQFWERVRVKAFPKREGEMTVSIRPVIVLSCTWS
jgi:hypothetical protein